MPKGPHFGVLGHSLAAPENRLPFTDDNLNASLFAPKAWQSPGTRHLQVTSASGGIHALNTIGRRHNALFVYRGLSSGLQTQNVDLLYLWEEPWSLPAWQACQWAKRYGKPWLFFSAENRPKPLPPPFSQLRQRVFARAAGAIVPTAEVAENLRRHGYTGVTYEIPLWTAPKPWVEADRTPILAFVGRLIPLKRVDVLIRAAARASNFRLRIIGDGPEENNLRDLAHQLGFDDRIQFVGYVPHQELNSALQGCCALILPTAATPRRAEQFGKSVIEAIAFGLPVLVSNTGNLGEWMKTFDSVRIVRCDRDMDLEEDIQNFLKNPVSREIRLAMREKVQQRYGLKTTTLRFRAAFEDTWSRSQKR